MVWPNCIELYFFSLFMSFLFFWESVMMMMMIAYCFESNETKILKFISRRNKRKREMEKSMMPRSFLKLFFLNSFFLFFFHLFVLFLLSKTKTIINIQLFGLEIVNWLDLKKKLCVKRMNEKKNYLNNYLRTFDQFVILKMASLYLFYCYIYENDQNKTNDQFYCRHLCCLFSIRSIDSIDFDFKIFFFFWHMDIWF